MSDNPRNTQFANAAKLTLDELIRHSHTNGEVMDVETYNQRLQRIIARRLYDVSQHSVGHTLEYLHECGQELSWKMDTDRILPAIPDITDWKQWGLPNE